MAQRSMVRGTALAAGLIVAVGACSDDGSGPEDPGTPPELPPLTSMSADFSFFNAQGQQAEGLVPSASASEAGLHFTNAAIRVFAAQLATAVVLAVPTATFVVAANSVPTFEDDGLWHWRFSAAEQGQTYGAHLSGNVQGGDVVWTMRITSPTHNPPLDEFVWFGGQGRVDRTSGTWTFYDPSTPSVANTVLTIDWTHASESDHGFTATSSSGLTDGDVFEVSIDGTERMLTYSDASEQSYTEIWWDSATGVGYLIAPNYNGGVQACWDANQEDLAECP